MTRSQTILLIDDDAMIQRLVQARLRRLEVEVLCASDGPTGLEIARKQQPELVLLDVAMPGMDGFEVFQKLRHDPLTRDMPVIFLTGDDRRDERVRGLEMGAMDYVTKPFDAAELRARVGTALRTQALVDALETQAWTDDLTGLPNRGAFRKAVHLCLERTRHEPGYRFAVLFLDLDRFKLVNDSLGHGIGDELLIATANKLRRCIREARQESEDRSRDMVARLGGDEFAVLLDGVGGTEIASAVATRLEDELANPFVAGGYHANLGASIGIKLCDHTSEGTEQLLRDCDTAMYRAKTFGGGRHVLFDAHMHEEAVRRLSLEHELHEALEHEQFALHYQPLIKLEDGSLLGFEALIRWEHPERGLVGPDRFIPVAEETGLIFQIGEWALWEACRQLRQWSERLPGEAPIVSVNISRAQLQAFNLVELVSHVLEQTGVEPDRLKIEITETAIMHDIEAVVPVLNRIRELGVRVALDDFGTGYSSLASLHRFPIDILKIDKAFVHSMGHSRVHAAIIQTITNLAHNLGLPVIAEGIETDEQIALLQALNCDYVQGFRFGRPVPAAELPDHLLIQRQWAKTA